MKAYGHVDWSYLRLIMVQIGPSPNLVEWIIIVVSSSQVVVLVNGVPYETFKGNRGLRQGYPLSPYLFILDIEGLNLLISRTKTQNIFSGLNLSDIIFVNDVLIICGGSLEE